MSTEHGTIEFINRHSVAVSIDVLDDDNDEYVVATLSAGTATRQYTTPGTRWSVRVVYPFGMDGATFLNLRDTGGAERFSQKLDDVHGEGGSGQSWTVEIQYVVTARAGAQSYMITAQGLQPITTNRPAAVLGDEDPRRAVLSD